MPLKLLTITQNEFIVSIMEALLVIGVIILVFILMCIGGIVSFLADIFSFILGAGIILGLIGVGVAIVAAGMPLGWILIGLGFLLLMGSFGGGE